MGRPRKNQEGNEMNFVAKVKETEEEKLIRHSKEDAEYRKMAEKDWDNAWYEIKNKKLLKCVRAKNGSVYRTYVFTIKNDEQKNKVKELKSKNLIKNLDEF